MYISQVSGERLQDHWSSGLLFFFNFFPGHADKIRSAMSGFQLPTSHIPDWAKSLNENQWQEQVVNRLVGQDSCDNQEKASDNSGSGLQQKVSDNQTEAGTSVSETRTPEDTTSEEITNKMDSGADTSQKT